MTEKTDRVRTALVIAIALMAAGAAAAGIFSGGNCEPFEHTTVRGATVMIRGDGVYRHMSTDVAVQGIGQDYVTLFIAVPLLLILGPGAGRGPRRELLRAGILAYFFVTHLFYMLMGTYNELFLVYVLLTSLSFFALARTLLSINLSALPDSVGEKAPTRGAGRFLMVIAVLMAALWLQVVVPPLFDGTVIPPAVQHYTTLVVQGMDLAILLPLSFLSGWWLVRRTALGLLLGTTYLVFLSLLMTALTAKLAAMAATGASVVPAIFIIPVINLVTIFTAVRIVRAIRA